ncbi:MAG: hypothetical protein ACD_75C00331G0011 [uncultured bacterium]|nr:MAG: hypothetical protein ACD_75C00331G0011 [uncultured bacterium]
MTTIREDIDLARVSYAEDLANDPQWQVMEKQGWQHIGRSDKLLDDPVLRKDAAANGFSADAFRSPSGEIVIANRGTEPTSIKDLWADFQLAFGIEPGQADSARAFVDAVKAELQIRGEEVSAIHMTGHSLGDYLAQTGVKYVNKEYEGQIHATGFGLNGPGIGEADTSSTDFVHLQLDSDLVHHAGGDHLGVDFTIDSITPKYSPLTAHSSDSELLIRVY